jgi:ATP-dependent DNA helicase RecG
VPRSDAELRALLTDLESDQVERKASAADGDRIGEAVCAFSNDYPGHGTSGVLFVGVDDGGTPTGLTIDDDLLLRLATHRDNGKILPLPSMRVARLEVADHQVAVIEVEPSPSPPVRFRGRVWIRVGPRRALATADEERRLSERRRSGDLTFDARPLHPAVLDDLDLEVFRREYLPAALPADVLDENGRTVVEQLAALRLCTLDGVPTAAGVLLLAPDPLRFLPGAAVQFLRIDGDTLDDPIVDEKRLSGPVPLVLRQLDELIILNVHNAVRIGEGLRDERTSDYPVRALQQLTRNAVMHRNYEGTASPIRVSWYADRVEIFSPGGPYGTVSVDNFGQPGLTDYRNPVLAEAMRNLGFVQRFGAGLDIARGSLRANGNPPAEFTVDAAFVAVTLRGAP